jgi:hypothetical protein
VDVDGCATADRAPLPAVRLACYPRRLLLGTVADKVLRAAEALVFGDRVRCHSFFLGGG